MKHKNINNRFLRAFLSPISTHIKQVIDDIQKRSIEHLIELKDKA